MTQLCSHFYLPHGKFYIDEFLFLQNVLLIVQLCHLLSHQPIYQVYANKISTAIFRETRKPILLAIALKDKQPANIPSISKIVLQNDVWS